mgnify:CR=1 FL=1
MLYKCTGGAGTYRCQTGRSAAYNTGAIIKEKFMWWQLPVAFVIGFAIQWVYHPGSTNSMVFSMCKMVVALAGTLTAFYVWYK